MRLKRQPFFQELLQGLYGKLFAEFLLKFGFGKADALAAALNRTAHGDKIGIWVQDRLASAS